MDKDNKDENFFDRNHGHKQLRKEINCFLDLDDKDASDFLRDCLENPSPETKIIKKIIGESMGKGWSEDKIRERFAELRESDG